MLPALMVDKSGTLMILFNFEGLKTLEPGHEKTRGCSSAGRAPALQAGGREFEPHHLHQRAPDGPSRGADGAGMWAYSSAG